MIFRILFSPFILLSIFLFHCNSVQAANLYAIVVCDTDASNIEKSVKADYKNIRKEIKRIKKYTKLKTRIKKFKGRKVNSDFLDVVRRINVEPDDVILFYWSGHGKRFESQEDPWPVLDFEHDNQIVTQYDVTEELMDKHPRLILSITDCCNNFVTKSFFAKSKSDKKLLKENYQALFLNSKGTYIATAALPGEISFALNRNSKILGIPAGGFFTNALLESLKTETSQPNPDISWDLIFELTINKTIEYQLRDEADPYVYHYPQYQYIAH